MPRLPEGVTVQRDLEYARIGDRSLRLDLYRPARSESRLPLVIWVHGGAWLSGSKEGTPAVALVPRGFAVASISYRLSQEARFPAQIHEKSAQLGSRAPSHCETR